MEYSMLIPLVAAMLAFMLLMFLLMTVAVGFLHSIDNNVAAITRRVADMDERDAEIKKSADQHHFSVPMPAMPSVQRKRETDPRILSMAGIRQSQQADLPKPGGAQ